MKSLTKVEQESNPNSKFSCISKEKFKNKYVKGKNIVELEILAIAYVI